MIKHITNIIIDNMNNEGMSVDSQIDQLVRENMIHRFASELQNTTGEERKEQIREILRITQRSEKDPMEAKNKLLKIYSNIDTELLKRKWTKLSDLQKKDRLREYAKRTIVDEKKRKKVENKIIKMLNDKTLKQKQVNYDNVIGQIKSIDIDIDIEESSSDESESEESEGSEEESE